MRYLVLLVILFLCVRLYSQDRNNPDSLLEKLEEFEKICEEPCLADTNTINTLINLASHYQNRQTDTALFYISKALALAEVIQDKKSIGLSLMVKGETMKNLSLFDEAITIFERASRIFLEIDYSEGYTKTLNQIGIVHQNQGNYDKAIDFYQKSLETEFGKTDKKSMSSSHMNIGVIHWLQGNYDRSSEYFEKALVLLTELGDKQGMSRCYGNMGIIKYHQKKYEEAIVFYEKTLDIFEELGDLKGMAISYNNLGSVNQDLTAYEKALEYYQKALIVKEKLGDRNGISIVLVNISLLNVALGDSATSISEKQIYYTKAVEYAEKSLAIAEEVESLMLINENYNSLYKAWAGLGDYAKAFEYSKKYTESKDSLYNQDKLKAIEEMEAKYQNEKKQQQIELQEAEIAVKDAAVSREKYQKRALYVVLGLSVLILVVIIFYYLQKRKANQLLSRQRDEIEKQAGELQLKNSELEQQKEEIRAQADNLTEANFELEKMNDELEKLSIVARETDNSVVIADPNGNLLWVNEGFTRLYGYKLEEFVKMRGINMMEASSNPDIKLKIQECFDEKKAVTYSSLNTTKEGRGLWIQTTLTPIINKEGEIYRLVAIDSDIDKLKKAESEIKQQNEEIQAQSELLFETNKILEVKNEQITDSISYAKLIQEAILPSQALIKKLFPESFIYFRPRDIVSGDFYWMAERGQKLYFAVADSTGHGVPGAFMSMIGSTMLDDIVKTSGVTKPSQILEKLNLGIINALQKSDNESNHRDDGMDITICCIDREQNKLDVACANHFFYIVRNKKLERVRGDIFSIGGQIITKAVVEFTDHSYFLDTDTSLYMFSDGYSDQFGGTKEMKFMSLRFEKMIAENHHRDMDEQLEIIDREFNKWIMPVELPGKRHFQIDDVLVVGLKIN